MRDTSYSLFMYFWKIKIIEHVFYIAIFYFTTLYCILILNSLYLILDTECSCKIDLFIALNNIRLKYTEKRH